MNAIQFGNKADQFDFFDRPGAYAIICNEKDEFGIVENNGSYFFPGGGIEKGETENDALLRGVREETGIEVKIERFLGNADEYQISFDRTMKFNQIGHFYKCVIIEDHHDQSDLSHKFKWLDFSAIKPKMARRSHLWAMNLSLNGLDVFEILDGEVPINGKYRLVRNNELDELLKLYGHLHKNDESPANLNEYRNIWKEISQNPRILYFGAELNGELVSSCHLSIIPNLTRGCKPYGTIENVVTRDDYRSKGIGKGILKYALNTAWSFGCYKVMLMTGSKKEWVHKFYEDVGFEKNVKTAFIAKP